jgi:hypothetical protein
VQAEEAMMRGMEAEAGAEVDPSFSSSPIPSMDSHELVAAMKEMALLLGHAAGSSAGSSGGAEGE